MKCPACKRENRETAGYCAWCGTPLESTKAPEQTTEQPSDPVMPAPAEQSSETAPLHAPTEPAKRETPKQPTPREAEPPGEKASSGEAVSSLSRPFELDEEIERRAAQEREARQAAAPVKDATEPAPDESLEGVASDEEPAEQEPSTADEAAQAGPLSPDTVLQERYRIVELVQESDDYNEYRAEDLHCCPYCGYDQNMIEDEYCHRCGAVLDTHCVVTILEEVRHTPPEHQQRFRHSDREYFVRVKEEEQEPSAAPSLNLRWGEATDSGLQRDHNEDTIDAHVYTRGKNETLGLFVVADGLGGQDSGEVASQMAVDAVWDDLRHRVWEPILSGKSLEADAIESEVIAAVQTANTAVYEARRERNSEMSTTLTLALVTNGVAFIANVGDSRTYLWNGQGLHLVTHDHSLVQRLVDAGKLEQHDVYTHPQRHVIYSSIGDRPDVKLDAYRHTLAPDDRLILCSDGLWEMVREEGLEEVLLSEPEPQRACDRLVHNANLAGGEDNISVIIVQALA